MSRVLLHQVGPEHRVRFDSEADYQAILSARNSEPGIIIGPQGAPGNRGRDGDKGVDGNPGQDGESWVPAFGNPGGIVPLNDAGIVGYEYLGAEWQVSSAPAPGAGPMKSAAIAIPANFSGSGTLVPYSTKLHDQAGFVDPADPVGVLRVPASYVPSGAKVWVQPQYHFETSSTTSQRIVQLLINDVSITGTRTQLIANGPRGNSFQMQWYLVDPGTKFHVTYNSIAGNNMLSGSWFQISVRKTA